MHDCSARIPWPPTPASVKSGSYYSKSSLMDMINQLKTGHKAIRNRARECYYLPKMCRHCLGCTTSSTILVGPPLHYTYEPQIAKWIPDLVDVIDKLADGCFSYCKRSLKSFIVQKSSIKQSMHYHYCLPSRRTAPQSTTPFPSWHSLPHQRKKGSREQNHWYHWRLRWKWIQFYLTGITCRESNGEH